MNYNSEWKNFKVIATGAGKKLEEYSGIKLLRPDPQIIWEPDKDFSAYKDIWASYERSETGGGEWKTHKTVPNEFKINWRSLVFSLKLMGFKHTGVFPEQAYNWDLIIKTITNANRPVSVLNLFAYTGGATLASALAGAKVTHIDSAKAMCERAGKNAELSGLKDKPIRYIVDDCIKFTEREIRRNNKYDAIIMDPPSFGRGPNGEMWKLEDKLFDLVKLTKGVLSDKPLFYLINSYTTGLQPAVMKNILDIVFKNQAHQTNAYEIGIPTEEGIVLPAGASAFLTFT
ncbi:MAG: class I SAM-dependent methyltransferase [Firmicutes bacterium]|nr:class I SAM-dependent methyltransferase [Bacillota bacterium]